MDVALYHPEYGYYRSKRDPFGRGGDFYTAVQLQPSFGRLIRAVLEKFSASHTLIDVGAGRGEMREQFHEWNYISIDSSDRLPVDLDGVIFANELFDALPCRAYDAEGVEALVDYRDDGFVWTREPHYEECPRAFTMLDAMGAALRSGYLLIIDYGYEERERTLRFPRGTLMSYRGHTASENIFNTPGERDITTHVNFTAIERHASTLGFERVKRSSLAAFLLEAGEETMRELAVDHSQQLKSLLFGMGETFQVLLMKRVEGLKTLAEKGMHKK